MVVDGLRARGYERHKVEQVKGSKLKGRKGTSIYRVAKVLGTHPGLVHLEVEPKSGKSQVVAVVGDGSKYVDLRSYKLNDSARKYVEAVKRKSRGVS